MKPLPEVVPGLLVIQIPIQAVCHTLVAQMLTLLVRDRLWINLLYTNKFD